MAQPTDDDKINEHRLEKKNNENMVFETNRSLLFSRRDTSVHFGRLLFKPQYNSPPTVL